MIDNLQLTCLIIDKQRNIFGRYRPSRRASEKIIENTRVVVAIPQVVELGLYTALRIGAIEVVGDSDYNGVGIALVSREIGAFQPFIAVEYPGGNGYENQDVGYIFHCGKGQKMFDLV
ncbi:hypothetical protein D3C87_1483110 [compost metagenome]